MKTSLALYQCADGKIVQVPAGYAGNLGSLCAVKHVPSTSAEGLAMLAVVLVFCGWRLMKIAREK